MIYKACHDHDVFVRLNRWEIFFACQVAKILWGKSHADGRVDHPTIGKRGENNGEVDPGYRNQCLGAVSERAIAKALNIYWPSHIDVFGKPDLPFNIEAKLIGLDWFGLKVKEKMPDDLRVVGAVILRGHEYEPYRIPGWIRAADGKRPEWLIRPHGGEPFYAVPQSELQPLSSLVSIIATEMQQPLFA